jgi:hypothetical protein
MLTVMVVVLLPVEVRGGVSWSSPNLIDHFAGIDILPNAVQASNGTIWIAWQSGRYQGSTARYDVLYKTKTAGALSSTHNFTTSGMNAGPVLAQLTNGTIILFWSANPTGLSCSPQCNLYYERYNSLAQTWSTPVRLSSGLFNDSQSSAAVGPDGTLWLEWTRVVTNCSVTPCSVTKQLYYRTLKNDAWSPEIQLTTDSNWNSGGSVIVGRDSVVRVTWGKSPVGSGSQIYYKTFNGAWSPDKQIVTSTTFDEHPSIVQDRNGTFWVFWGRQIFYTLLDFHYELFDKYSVDNGSTWSSEAQITNMATTVDSKMPSAIQASGSSGTSLWIFYSTNYLFNDFDIWALMSSSIYPIHDVTVSSITASPGPGTTWTITVTVLDLGDYSETVIVSLSLYNSTSYSLGPSSGFVNLGASTSIVFTWNTAGVPSGIYGATATVSPVPGQSPGNQGHNSLQVGSLIQIIQVVVPSTGGGKAPVRF